MNIALALSGGSGTRLGSELPKQYWTIAEKPVIVHTLEQFERFEAVEGVICVAAQEWSERIGIGKRRMDFPNSGRLRRPAQTVSSRFETGFWRRKGSCREKPQA